MLSKLMVHSTIPCCCLKQCWINCRHTALYRKPLWFFGRKGPSNVLIFLKCFCKHFCRNIFPSRSFLFALFSFLVFWYFIFVSLSFILERSRIGFTARFRRGNLIFWRTVVSYSLDDGKKHLGVNHWTIPIIKHARRVTSNHSNQAMGLRRISWS